MNGELKFISYFVTCFKLKKYCFSLLFNSRANAKDIGSRPAGSSAAVFKESTDVCFVRSDEGERGRSMAAEIEMSFVTLAVHARQLYLKKYK